ncbi:MAG TPA: PIN domain-containing protein [Thermomicrobiales bacterium]|nr:PIN domain-containing protein [Thermomicrobiales bacterium]
MSGRITLPVAVLDASVLVPTWSRKILQTLASGTPPRYEPVWSEWIIAETWRVLTDRLARAEVARSEIAGQANRMLHFLLPVMRLVSVRAVPPAARSSPLIDPNDALVWATAVIAEAGYIVSHNTVHFPPLTQEHAVVEGRNCVLHRHMHQGIECLTAIEFIEDVLGEDAAAVYGRPLPAAGLVRSHRAITPT